jgi:hypothetical protein
MSKRILGGFMVFALAGGLLHCESSSLNVDPGTPDGGTGSDPDAAPVIECTAPTGAGTKHDANIEADETWTVANSPHIIDRSINIRSGAKLTIEPCAEVHLGKDASLGVAIVPTPGQGTLLAEGTATRPITFKRLGADPWGAVTVMKPGKATLRHVTLEGGGGDATYFESTLAVRGDSDLPVARDVVVDHVTIKGSKGYGAVLYQGGAFSADSTDLVVTGSGKQPIRIHENAIGSLPKGSYTGNAKDEIHLIGEGIRPYAGIQESQTMKDVGVPYLVGEGHAADSLRIEENSITKAPSTLTIEPGVTVKFTKGAGFNINFFTGDNPAGGALVAVGTAAKPIVFTSAEATPQAGDWQGLSFGGVPLGTNKLEHVKIEYAGGECLCVLISCNNVTAHEASIIFTRAPSAGFSITNSTIANSAGHGIHRAWQSNSQPSFAATNTFTNNAGCNETRPVPENGQCPVTPLPGCPE